MLGSASVKIPKEPKVSQRSYEFDLEFELENTYSSNSAGTLEMSARGRADGILQEDDARRHWHLPPRSSNGEVRGPRQSALDRWMWPGVLRSPSSG